MYVVEVQDWWGNLAALYQPLTRQSYTSQRLVPPLHFKTIESLTCLRQQQRLTTPPLGSPYALFILLYGASADAAELEADWDIKQAANSAAPYHKSEEEQASGPSRSGFTSPPSACGRSLVPRGRKRRKRRRS